MSLEPKDLRLKLPPAIHAGLDVCAEVDGVGLAELAERVLSQYVTARVHEATVIADRAHHLGISGKNRELRGKSGKGS